MRSSGGLNMNCEKWSLGSGQVYAYVQSYKDETKVHLRNFLIVGSGKCYPTEKGVTLNFEEWEAFKSLIQTIDLEFRKQLSQRVETSEKHPPWHYGVGEIPKVSSDESLCPTFENNYR